MKRHVAIAVMLTLAALGGRVALALQLANDDDDDGHFYSQIARNLLDQRGYSGETEEPYAPTYVRVPGYPILLAGVYGVFGRDNNRAVRFAQAAADTITCWLVALLAAAWCPAGWDPLKRRRAGLVALGIAAACPFVAIYVTTILTETWATMLSTACVLAATLALKSESVIKRSSWWLLAGASGGAATMFRPDCAIFVGGAGMALVTTELYRAWRQSSLRVLVSTLASGLLLALGFAAVLAPWTIRNFRVFGVFQPVAPPFANMPNEFAPMGYIAWLRTWVDDERYVGPIEDSLNLYAINIDKIPDSAFDSPKERERVAGLLEQYNHPVMQPADDPPDEDSTPAANDETLPTMTPGLDADFAEIARERISRSPVRYYFTLPLKRAFSLWFDTHSRFYPFQGELFPLHNLDRASHQQYWLPLFALLTLIYTGLALAGVLVMIRTEGVRRWVLLLALLILPRLAFLAAQEHPEGRYTAEFFPLVIAAGGVALAGARWLRSRPRAFQNRQRAD